MPRVAPWPWWQQPTGTDAYRIRELLRAILDLHAYYGDSATWLWRGQANAAHPLKPAIHTRIEINGDTVDDREVVQRTTEILNSARSAHLDDHEGISLPDLPLLALLQHHGAATPLLDVSLDPLVALYMAVVSPSQADDHEPGVLFAIRKPEDPLPADLVRPFDTRSFEQVYTGLPDTSVVFYTAPDVSERLRIQRGYFLLAKVRSGDPRVSVPLSHDTGPPGTTWLHERMARRGRSGKLHVPLCDIGTFRIPPQFKPSLREWLETRTGLTADFVYPTAWHQPYLEAFARSHGRLSRYR